MKLYQFQQLAKADKSEDLFELIAIYTGRDYNEVKHTVKVSEFDMWRKRIEKELRLPETGQYRKWFRLGWRLYRVPYSIDQWSAQQYIEVTTFVDRGIIDNCHFIIAAMLKSRNKKRLADRIQKRLDARVALSMAVFFCKFWKALRASDPDYSAEEAKAVGSNGDGDGRLLYSEFTSI